MATITIPTSFNISLEFEAASFMRRLAAWAVDVVIQILYVWLAFWFLGSLLMDTGRNIYSDDWGYNLQALLLIVLLPLSVYHLVFEIFMNGQSPGKRFMRVRVVDARGGRAGIGQYVIRWSLRMADTWMILIVLAALTMLKGNKSAEGILFFLFGFGFLVTDVVLVTLTKRSQRVGDILANTILIKINNKESLEKTIFREVQENYVPMFPQVMRISDRDLNIIRRILDSTHTSKDFTNAALAAEKIKTYLKIETPLPPYEFMERLLLDYNYLSTK